MRHKLDIPGNLRLTTKHLTVPINRYTIYNVKQIQNDTSCVVRQFWGHKLHGYSVEWAKDQLIIRAYWKYIVHNQQWDIAIAFGCSSINYRTAEYNLQSILSHQHFDITYEQSSVLINIGESTNGVYIEVQGKSLLPEWNSRMLGFTLPEGDVLFKTLYVLERLNYLNDDLPDWAVKLV